MKNITLRQIAVLIAAFATIALNSVSQAARWNGYTSGEITDIFFPQVLTVPAGYVFAIWGVIYLGMIAYAVSQALPRNRENPRLKSIGWLFVVSCFANVIWLVAFHWLQFALSLPFMLILIACLITIYLRLGVGRAQVSSGERWFVHVPFSVYLGWITVATIANVSFVLFELGFPTAFLGISAEIWTALLLVIAVGIALLMVLRHGDIAYALVLVWALAGIYAKRVNSEFTVAATAGIVAAVVIAVIILLYALNSLRRMPNKPTPAAA